MATVRHSLYQKTKHSQNDIWKSLFLQTFVNIVLVALFIIVEQSVKQKFRGGPTEPQMRWNFVLHSLRRLLFPLRPKLTRCARSDKGLRGNAMLAHEENSNASAYSVCPPRNFCFTDYSTIMNNAARTILTKVCKNRLFQISFWLCFVFWQSECLTVAIIFIGSARDKKPRKHKVLV